jgi:hypothetical protein
MNLKFSEFPEDLREVKEDHSELRRASALFVRIKRKKQSWQDEIFTNIQ